MKHRVDLREKMVNLMIFLLVLITVSLSGILFLLPSYAADSQIYTVDNLTDENDGDCTDGDCSFREAVSSATSGNNNTIAFNPALSGTITLASPVSIFTGGTSNNITIDGEVDGSNNPKVTINIDGSDQYLLIFGTTGTVTIKDLSLDHSGVGNDSFAIMWGFGVDNCAGATFDNLRITNATYGIFLSDNTLGGNTVTNCAITGAEMGIGLTADGNVVTGNNIVNPTNYGISIGTSEGETSDNNTISNNTISNPGSIGISFNGAGSSSGNMVNSNVISGITDGVSNAGIYVTAAVGSSVFSGNIISGTGANSTGIYIENDSPGNSIDDSVAANQITGAFGMGIYSNANDTTVNGVNVSDAVLGIKFNQGTTGGVATANTILNCVNDGFKIDGTVDTFNDNIISGSGNYGVELTEDALIISATGNTYTDNGSNSPVDRYFATYAPLRYGGTNYSDSVYFLYNTPAMEGRSSQGDLRLTGMDGTTNYNVSVGTYQGVPTTFYSDDSVGTSCGDIETFLAGYGLNYVCDYYEDDVWVAPIIPGDSYTWSLDGATLADDGAYTSPPTLSAPITEYTGAGLYIWGNGADSTFTNETFINNDNSIIIGGGGTINSLAFATITNTTPRGYDYVCSDVDGDWSITNMDLTADNNYNSCAGILTVNQKAKAHITYNGLDINNASVSFKDVNGTEKATGTTGVDGNTAVVTLPVYTQSDTTTTSFNDYTIRAAVAGYTEGNTNTTLTNSNSNITIQGYVMSPTRSVTGSTASEAVDGSGKVNVQFTVSDSNAATYQASVYYSLNGGTSYSKATLSTADSETTTTYSDPTVNNSATYQLSGITTASGANTVSTVWNSAVDAPTSDITNAKIGIIVYDGYVYADGATTSNFSLDNVGPAGLGGFAAATSSNSANVVFTWSAATDTNFNHYEIWYGTSESDVSSRIGTATEWDNFTGADLAATITATNTNFSPLTFYYAKIWAIDDYSNESATAVTSFTTNNIGSHYYPSCGNSIVDSGEDCDPPTSACQPSYGSTCTYCGASCRWVILNGEYCGDGVKNIDEQCDDGNLVNNDGCSASCQTEINPPGEYCGDNIVNGSEQCDDGNTISGDGCSATCQKEVSVNCGNGVVDQGEDCDGANLNNQTCKILGYKSGTLSCSSDCFFDKSQCVLVVTLPVCGDKVCGQEETCSSCPADCGICNKEFCGDKICNNQESCHSCAADCGSCPSIFCGDENCNGDENCSTCPIDCGVCNSQFCGDGGCGKNESCSSCPADCGDCAVVSSASCGNGSLELNEQCDDGNTINGDGCSATCQLENSAIEEEIEEEQSTTPGSLLEKLFLNITVANQPAKTDLVTQALNRVLPTSIARSISQVIDQPAVEQTNQIIAAPILIILTGANTAAAASSAGLLAYLPYFFTEPLRLFFRRRKKGWGVIYNTITKQPIDLAVVRLYTGDHNSAGQTKLVSTRVTDRQGRYDFVVDPLKQYFITVQKDNFIFPSQVMSGQTQDEKYPDIYTGKEAIHQVNLVAKNIPLDPNLPQETDHQILKRHSVDFMRRTVSLAGPILSLISLLISPTIWILLLVAIHFSFFGIFFRLSARAKSFAPGQVTEPSTGRPIKQAVLRLYSPAYNKLIATEVTSSQGEYSFLVGNQAYYLTASKDGYQPTKTDQIDLTKAEETVVREKIKMDKAKPATFNGSTTGNRI